MREKRKQKPNTLVWKQFSGKGYGAFASLKRQFCIGVLSVATLGSAAQAQSETHDTTISTKRQVSEDEHTEMDEVTVSGTMAPLTALQSVRIVSVLTRTEIERAGVQSVNDLLKLTSGIDVRQRGGFGIQTDISIDGGHYEQITLLLNGVNINNPQVGHFNADIPISISDIERIEVLEGAASRVYGGQSFGGAINIVTRKSKQSNLSVGAEGGMHGTVQADGRVELAKGSWANRISGGGGRTNGGTQNSSWKKGQLYYQGDWTSRNVDVNWQFGFSKKSYGANTFYSAAYPNQYERNERYIVSVGAQTKGNFVLKPTVYWQRAYDNFELTHHSPVGENFHYCDAFGLKIGGYHSWWAGKTAYSTELRHEGIMSTNLGKELDPSLYVSVHGEENISYTRHDERTIFSYGLEHNIMLERWTISFGVMGCLTPSIDTRSRFYPGADVSYRAGQNWKIFASYNRGFRLPSFTELYYKSPTHEGNRELRPETNNSFQLGAQYQKSGINASARLFYHKGNGIIDWVMYNANDTYHSTAFKLDNVGLQATARIDFETLLQRNTYLQTIDVGYTFIHQERYHGEEIFKSNSALEYLRHKLVVQLHHRILSHLSATWSLRWQDRNGGYISNNQTIAYSPYATLDAKIQWSKPRYEVYLTGTNLTDRHYYDLGNVPQPGLWIMAGARVKLQL